jgi:hypothetical protein
VGWNSGGEIFYNVIEILQKEMTDDAVRQRIYERLIPAFQNQDWDTEMECVGTDPAYDAALKKLEPSWFDE